jgi:hypothetical protein
MKDIISRVAVPIGIFADIIAISSAFISTSIVCKIVSSIISILLFLTVSLYFIKFKDFWVARCLGIIGVYQSRDKLTNYIDKNKKIKSLKIIAVFGESLIPSIHDVIVNILTKNIRGDGEIKFLLATHDSAYIQELGTIENTSATISSTTATARGKLESCVKDARKKKGNSKQIGKIKIKYCNTQIRAALVIVNDEWAWYTPYLPPLLTENSISMVLENKGKKPYIKHCIEHFETIWDSIDEEHLVNGDTSNE